MNAYDLTTTVFHVHCYPYGGAHDGTGSTLAGDLTTALYLLGDELDAYLDSLIELAVTLETFESDYGDEDRTEVDNAITYVETFYRAVQAYADSTSLPSPGSREALDGALEWTSNGPRLIDGRGFAMSFDDPDASSAGRVFSVEPIALGEATGATTIDELDELATIDEDVERLLEDLDA